MRRLSFGVLFAGALLLAGCSGFWDATSSGGGGGGTASGDFYVLNQKTGQIVGFTFASGSTTPSTISGGTVSLGTVPLAMAISPNGSFLYVSTATGIYLFNIGSSGALSGPQAISTDQAYTMQVDATGQWLIEAIQGTGTLNAIPLTSSGQFNSSIQEQTTPLSTTNPQQIAVMPSATSTAAGANYIFVAMGTGGTAVIPFNPASTTPFGNGVVIPPRSTAGGDNTVAVDPTNPLLYVGETAAVSGTQSGGLRVLQIFSTKISEISGSPFATGGTGPSALLPTNGFVYVANRAVSGSTLGNITGYSVTANTGTSSTTYSLAMVSTVNAGLLPVDLAEESTSTYVLAVNAGGNPDLSTYTFDSTTKGKLNAGATAATGSDPVQAVAVVAVP